MTENLFFFEIRPALTTNCGEHVVTRAGCVIKRKKGKKGGGGVTKKKRLRTTTSQKKRTNKQTIKKNYSRYLIAGNKVLPSAKVLESGCVAAGAARSARGPTRVAVHASAAVVGIL